MPMTMPRLAIALSAVLAITGCSRAPQPEPALSPGQNAPINPARTELAGAVIEARIIDTRTLGEAMARHYRIQQDDGHWLLLVTVRDREGNGLPADAVQLSAKAGDLTTRPRPIPLRAIAVDGLHDWVGTIQAAGPTTLLVELDARRDGASTRLRFSRDLPSP